MKVILQNKLKEEAKEDSQQAAVRILLEYSK